MSLNYKAETDTLHKAKNRSWYPAWAYHVQNYSPLPAKTRNLTQKLTFINNLRGDGLRLRLSNRHGAAPLALSDMEVRICDSRSLLTVSGQKEISLAPGEELLTDPVKHRVRPGDLIEIRIFFPGNQTICGCCAFNSSLAGEAEFYQCRDEETPGTISSTENNFTSDYRIVPGSEISAAIQKGFSTQVVLGVCAVEVSCESRPRVLAVFGDSIVQQSQWYGALYRELTREFPGYAIYNEGISGNRVLLDNHSSSALNPIFGKAGIRRFEEDVYSRYHPDITIIAEGINDLVHPGNGCPANELPASGQLIRGLDALTSLARSRGSLPILATLTPFFNYDGIWSPEREAIRQKVNRWIRSRDHLVDIDASVRNQNDTKAVSPDYDCGDHLHLNAAGGGAAAREILRVITGLKDEIPASKDRETVINNRRAAI